MFTKVISVSLILAAVLFVSADGYGIEDNPLVINSTKTSPGLLRKLRALRQNVVDKGCDVNVCFAIQGDAYITDKEFQDMKDFIDLMIAILFTDTSGNYCAVQYGRTTYRIAPLSRRKQWFLNRVQNARKVNGFNTNIAGALGYMGFQMLARAEDANQIIVLGDGLESVGFPPKWITRKIHQSGYIDVAAVAVGGASYPALKALVGGDPNKIVELDEFFELAEIVVGLVSGLCGFESGFFF